MPRNEAKCFVIWHLRANLWTNCGSLHCFMSCLQNHCIIGFKHHPADSRTLRFVQNSLKTECSEKANHINIKRPTTKGQNFRNKPTMIYNMPATRIHRKVWCQIPVRNHNKPSEICPKHFCFSRECPTKSISSHNQPECWPFCCAKFPPLQKRNRQKWRTGTSASSAIGQQGPEAPTTVKENENPVLRN